MIGLTACSTYQAPNQKIDVAIPTEWQFRHDVDHNQSQQVTTPSSTNETFAKLLHHEPPNISNWWKNWQDPAFDQLLRYALEHNRDIRNSYTQVALLRKQMQLSQENTQPSVTGSGGFSRTHTKDRNPSNQWSTGIQAKWEWDLWGMQQDQILANQSAWLAQNYSMQQQQISLAATLAQTYTQWRLSKARLQLNNRINQLQNRLVQIAKWRHAAGLVSKIDVLQAQNAYQRSRIDQTTLEKSVENLQIQLQILLGGDNPAQELVRKIHQDSKQSELLHAKTNFSTPRKNATYRRSAQKTSNSWDGLHKTDADQLTIDPQHFLEIIPQFNGPKQLDIPAVTLMQRPDLKAQLALIDQQWWVWQRATKNQLPNFNLTGSLNDSELTLGKLLSLRSWVAQFIANISAPLWDGGRIDQTVSIEKTRYDLTKQQYEKLLMTAVGEIETALSNRYYTSQINQQLANQWQQTEQLAQIANLQYRYGLTDMTTVITSLSQAQSLLDNWLQNRAALTVAHIDLYRVLGGGWSVSLPQSQH